MSTEHCEVNRFFWSRSSARSLLLVCSHAQENANKAPLKKHALPFPGLLVLYAVFRSRIPTCGQTQKKSDGLLLMLTAHFRTDHPLTHTGRLLPAPDDPVASPLHPPPQPLHTPTSRPAAQPAASATSPAPSKTAPSPASPRPARWP